MSARTTSKTIASFALMLLARTAGAEVGGTLPWQDSFTARLEALAPRHTLNAERQRNADPRPLVRRPPVDLAGAHRRRASGTAPTKRRKRSSVSFYA
jgi:hypothetical protein